MPHLTVIGAWNGVDRSISDKDVEDALPDDFDGTIRKEAGEYFVEWSAGTPKEKMIQVGQALVKHGLEVY